MSDDDIDYERCIIGFRQTTSDDGTMTGTLLMCGYFATTEENEQSDGWACGYFNFSLKKTLAVVSFTIALMLFVWGAAMLLNASHALI
jgi:hypothetical protein